MHFRTPDALVPESRYFGLQIVTHEKQFVPAIRFGGMNRHFRRRQREDQPSLAGIHE
jgi:hypothetical protein